MSSSSDLEAQTSSAFKTKTGFVVGTVPYMSPEQLKDLELDRRTDIFSLGVVLYEMTTGNHPFSGESQAVMINAILNEDPVPPAEIKSDIDPGFEEIILKMLEKDRDLRYQTSSELNADLITVQRDLASRRTRVHRRPSAKRILPGRVRWTAIFGGLSLLLLFAFAAAYFLWPENVSDPMHVVVLPVTNVSGDAGIQPICDGIMEDLTSKISALAKNQESMTVEPACEVRKHKIFTATDARKTFGATHVVTGSLQRQATSLRLNLNLVDTDLGEQIDADFIEDRADDGFALQDDAALKVIRMLEIKLGEEDQHLLTAGRTDKAGVFGRYLAGKGFLTASGQETTSRGYDAYLEGLGYLKQPEKSQNIDKAIGLFIEVIQDDPEFALAHAGLGEAYLFKHRISKEDGWIEKALNSCKRALNLNDELTAVHLLQGEIFRSAGRYDDAIIALKRASDLEPDNPSVHLAIAGVYESQAKYEEAESAYQKAIDIRPEYWLPHFELGSFYIQRGRLDDAEKHFLRVVAVAPEYSLSYVAIGGLYLYQNRWDDAKDAFMRSLEIQPNFQVYSNMGTYHFFHKRYAEAAKYFEKGLELDESQYGLWGNLASAYYYLPG
ncbi:tetratricopeptide repeat protein [Acidobacteriota bacterium]